MKKLSNDGSAISEIIGALMLVLIVVIAASSFAVFISQQQKIEQDNQLIKTEQEGESLLISSIATSTNDSIVWASLNITISSMHQGDSDIDQISVNNHVLKSYHVSMYSTLTNSWVFNAMDYTEKLTIPAQQVIHVFITMSDFFDTGVTINTDIPLNIHVITAYSNDFNKIFYAPTPIIIVNTESQWDGSINDFRSFWILDGSQSDQPGQSTIVNWSWNVTDSNGISHLLDGRMVRFDPPVGIHGLYTITLVVQNSNGMVGSSRTTYTF